MIKVLPRRPEMCRNCRSMSSLSQRHVKFRLIKVIRSRCTIGPLYVQDIKYFQLALLGFRSKKLWFEK
ncbi:unnamed protein product [Arabidopsis halleri]